MKKCTKCGQEKELSEFFKNRRAKDGHRADCKVCQTKYTKEWTTKNSEVVKARNKVYRARPDVLQHRCKISKEWNRKNQESVLLTHARKRAKEFNLECSITKEDIIIPEYCPVLGIKLSVSDGKVSYGSPSLDRIDSTKGYTKDNIQVISFRANVLKRDASFDEVEKIYLWLKGLNGK